MSEIHPQARTTPRTRAKIKASSASLTKLAERYNVSVATVRKWKRRETPEDLSHRPHSLSTTLTAAQEAIVVELRRLVLLPLDDLLVITREFINPHASRSGLDRCLRRHGVGSVAETNFLAAKVHIRACYELPAAASTAAALGSMRMAKTTKCKLAST